MKKIVHNRQVHSSFESQGYMGLRRLKIEILFEFWKNKS